MIAMSDLCAILDNIRQQPDHEPHWQALADHLCDNGEDVIATVVRAHWRACRELMHEGVSVEGVVARFRTIRLNDLVRLAAKTREREERGGSGA
jgi:hypothetical protein